MKEDSLFITSILSGTTTDRRIRNDTSTQPLTTPKPLSNISINIVQVCNSSCVYYYAGDGEYGMKGKMFFEMAKNA